MFTWLLWPHLIRFYSFHDFPLYNETQISSDHFYIIFLFFPLYDIITHNQQASPDRRAEAWPCKMMFPMGPCQMFKHDFHLSATVDLLLVLNVASTYDWSDLKFIFYCSVAPNQDQPVGLVYSLRAVDIYRYGINCACPEPFYRFSSVRMGIEQMLSGLLIEMITVLWNVHCFAWSFAGLAAVTLQIASAI